MAYIPRDAKWYIAEIVERLQVQGDPRAVVHVNLCLIEATGPAIAYRRALALGKAAEITYLNPKGRKVSIEFLGLRDLNVVHDRLEHGAELLYRQYVGLTAAAARKLVTRPTKLSVFRPLERPSGPDYSSAEVVEAALKLVYLAKTRRGSQRPRLSPLARRSPSSSRRARRSVTSSPISSSSAVRSARVNLTIAPSSKASPREGVQTEPTLPSSSSRRIRTIRFE